MCFQPWSSSRQSRPRDGPTPQTRPGPRRRGEWPDAARRDEPPDGATTTATGEGSPAGGGGSAPDPRDAAVAPGLPAAVGGRRGSAEGAPIDLVAARIHAGLWAQLAARSIAVGAHDLLIAATALATDSQVATRDTRSFPQIPGLSVVSW